MANDKLTTIQIDVETRDKLKELAEVNERSSTAQLRWLVGEEYRKFLFLKEFQEKQHSSESQRETRKAKAHAQSSS